MLNETKSLERKNVSQAGFSLVELMISIVVFLIFISAVYGLFRLGSIQKSVVNSQTEVIKNLRLSLNTIGRDAINAGLGYNRVGGYVPDNLTNARMGLPSDDNASHDLLTAVISGNNINSNNFLPANQKTDVIAFAYRDMTFNNGVPIELINAATYGSNGVTISTATNAAANAKPYDLYLISEGTRTAVALATSVPNSNTIRFETGDPLGINMLYTGSTDNRSKLVSCASYADECMDYTNRVTAKKVYWVSYSVLADGTLIRTTFGNNSNGAAAEQIQTQPIAYNIQNLQIKYLLTDGTVTDDPSNSGANQTQLNNVVQIDVTISSRVQVREGGVNITKVVDLSSTFSTRNLAYDID